MLERIKRQWREARGERLRREFEDAIRRLNSLGQEVNVRASLTWVESLRQVEATYGPLANISNDGKVRLVKKDYVGIASVNGPFVRASGDFPDS
jgi:hypothetical protein